MRFIKRTVLGILGMALLLLGIASCRQSVPESTGKTTYRSPAGKRHITIAGSDTMVNLGQSWAEMFMKTAPTISVAVRGGGSGTGITPLNNGAADIAETSRAMTADEIAAAKKNGINPNQITVAWDGVSVIVNPKNPVKKLTLNELDAMYTGVITNWKEVGGKDAPIVLLNRDPASGTFVFFREHVLRRGRSRMTADYSKDTRMLPSNQSVHDEVANNEQAIGYIGLGYVDELVTAVSIGKNPTGPFVLPSVAHVHDMSYPISRPLYWYTNGVPAVGSPIKQFVDFVIGPHGQKIVADMDFVPLR